MKTFWIAYFLSSHLLVKLQFQVVQLVTRPRITHHWACGGAMLAFTLCLSSARPILAAPLAILTDVRGGVQIVRGASKTVGKNGAKLEAGDMVRVAKGAATVYYVTRPPQMLKANQQVKVAAAGGAANKPSLWRNVYSGIASGFARREQNTPGVVRDPKMRLMWPVNSNVLQARPTFYWTNHPQATDYQPLIRDETGEEVWRGTVAAHTLTYPDDAPALQPGQKYFWDVIPYTSGVAGRNPVTTRYCPFFIVAPETEITTTFAEVDQIRRAMSRATDAQRRFAMAAALDQRGFYAEAIAQIVPEMLAPSIVNQGESRKVLNTVVPQLDSSSRLLLRGLWYGTNQEDLVKNLSLHTKP